MMVFFFLLVFVSLVVFFAQNKDLIALKCKIFRETDGQWTDSETSFNRNFVRSNYFTVRDSSRYHNYARNSTGGLRSKGTLVFPPFSLAAEHREEMLGVPSKWHYTAIKPFKGPALPTVFGCMAWLLIALMMAGLQEASYGPRVVSCWKNWLKMNDNNYLKALERYENCGKLVNDLSTELKEKYKRSLVDNLQRSSNYFFDHTEMSPADVIRVLRSANSLMESWTEDDVAVDGSPRGSSCDSDLPASRPPPKARPPLDNICDDGENENDGGNEDDGSCSEDDLKWFWWAKFMFYSYVALIVFQALILVLLFLNICCTDLLTSFPSCQYETQCCCEEDKEWITKVINECENQMKHNQKAEDPECYPLLLDSPARKVKSVTTVGYGTNIGKRGKKEEEILTDLTPLSSPRLGSDSEFEALMNRRPLKSLKKPRSSKIKLIE